MKDRIKRKLVWENKGVSEIIGTILMLAITVVMFSSIIIWVGQIPPPRESFQVELEATINPVDPDNWGLFGVDMIVTHQGGEIIVDLFTSIILTVDNTTLTKKVTDSQSADMDDDEWSVGEVWKFRVTQADVGSLTGPDPASTFSILILNIEKNVIVFQETIGEGESHYAPTIIDAWIDSDLGTPGVLDPGPITYTDQFKVYAWITDPEGIGGEYGLNESNLWVNLSTIYGDEHPPIQLSDWADVNDAVNDEIYVAICDAPRLEDVSPGNWFFTFNASDVTLPTPMTTERHILFPVGMIIGDNPQIMVREINFDDEQPVNGDTITITATIWNRGGVGAEVDVWFYDGNNQTLINTDTHGINITDDPDGIPDAIKIHPSAQGEVDADIKWLATPGGVHMIIVEAWVNETANPSIYDPYLNDNIGFRNLTVMPKILLVDDDNNLNDMSEHDTVSFMRASLEATDFEYDFTIVGAGDGPGYDYGDYPLEDYDIVIWMTGYQTTKTITTGSGDTDDVTNLEKYLDAGNGTGGNGGSLWFISQGFWEEADGNIPLTNFAEDYLNVLMPPTEKAGLPVELYGNISHNATDSFADNPIMTTNRISGGIYERSYFWHGVPAGRNALNSSESSYPDLYSYAVSYDSDDIVGNPVTDSRIYVQTWDFSRVRDTATQAQYTYKVIMWLGNITMKFTKDLAISEQTVEPKIVFYKQNVTIKFVIRNNGYDYNYTAADDLFYRLRILDVNGNELQPPVLKYEQVDYLGWGNNNTRTYYFNWAPQGIGFHRLEIKVDPDNRITESNELNNEISNYLTSGALFVQYRVLVVDDDNSGNNNGVLALNETEEVADALTYLNATDNYRFEQFIVDEMGSGLGPSYDEGNVSLNKYNAVIWVTGEDTGAPLKSEDQQNISEYLDNYGNFWLIGNGLWTNLDEFVDNFERDYLRIDIVDGNEGTSSPYVGVEDDVVSHGMVFSGVADVNADRLDPVPDVPGRPGGIGFFYQDDALTFNNSIRYEGKPPSANTSYRVATTAWLLSSLDTNESKAEIVFMMLRWFDKPEDRIEVRVTDLDMWLSDDHPQLGSGYVIQATVHNTGGSLGNVLVRFVDGTTQIGSDSISVSPAEITTAEIVWIPLYAGERTLHVYVDPIAEVDEIFEWSNNNASLSTYVYFFWDDMESGTARWHHSSTILLINGEEPLEYFFDTDMDTDIITEWDMNLSVGLESTGNHYHSFDTAFHLPEPTGAGGVAGRIPIDVVFALDTSGSMGGDPIEDLKTATRNFIMNLTEDDRAAIWIFGDNSYDFPYDDDTPANDRDPDMLLPFSYMNDVNKITFSNAINATSAGGWTCFYDTLGEAVRYALTDDTTASDMSRYEYVIGMTDGVSNSDEGYTPNDFWGQVSYQTDYGMDKDKQGLRRAPPMIYTIGLGITHDPTYPLAPDWSRNPPAPNEGVEYDVWSVADSSPTPEGKYGFNVTTAEPNVGHYYYTNDSSQLPGIFDQILESITMIQLEGENQTRGGGPIVQPAQTTTLFSETFVADDPDWRGDDSGDGAASQEWWYVENNIGDTMVGPYEGVPDGRCVLIRDADDDWGGDYIEGRYNGGNNWFDLTPYASGHYGYLNWTARAAGCEVGDQWRVEVTRNGGANWVVVEGPHSGNVPNSWTQYFYQLQPADFASNQWGFRINTDSGGNTDHHCFDDITLVVIEDATSPTIFSTSPFDGASGIAINAQVLITFSERMDTSSVTYSCTPDPGGWTQSWESGDTAIRLTHTNDFTMETLYTFEILTARDLGGNDFNNTGEPNPWTFTTLLDTFNPYIDTTSPFDGATLVTLDAPIVITFNETMNTTSVNWTCLPVDPGGWNPVWSVSDTILTLTHNTFLESTLYEFNVTFALDLKGFPLAPGPAPNPWTFETWKDIEPPTILYTSPWDGQTNVPINLQVIVRFSEKMNTTTVFKSCAPDPEGWITSWSLNDTLLTFYHNKFDINTEYQFEIVAAKDIGGNNFANTGAANPFTFTTGETAIAELNFNKTAVTGTMNLENIESAKLSFWHKYNMMPGANGGFLQVGYKDDTNGYPDDWDWRYVIPANAYTGNLRASVRVNDSYGQRIYWCWNGLSGRGTFTWDYVQVELLDFIPDSYRGEVKIKFNYTQYGQGTGYGWYFDDVRVRVARADTVPAVNTTQDIWNLTNMTAIGETAHSGNYAWSNVDPVTGEMKPGIDNYLKSNPIDLTNAKKAYLSAYFKFNLNEDSGAPPDGFRVEVTTDGGVTWTAINFGVRSSWGVSGTGLDIEDGSIDGRAYTGLCDSGDPIADDYWVNASSLSRVNVDLSSFSGNAIQLRFRVVTCNHPDYEHTNNHNPPYDDPGFGGFYVDDVIVYGETILT